MPSLLHPLLKRWPTDAFSRCLLLYVLLLPFVRIALLPLVQAKIQPTELVFLLLLPLGWLRYGSQLLPQSRWLNVALLTYFLANLSSALFAWDIHALLEAIGRGYLVLLALLVSAFVKETGRGSLDQLLQVFLYGTVVLVAITYLGYLAAVLGYDNSMVQVYAQYPYLGTVMRAKGFTGGAGMLIIVLLLPTIYAWRKWREGVASAWWFVFLFPLAGLTFSKEVLLLGLGLALVDPWFRRRGRGVQALLVGTVAVTFWLGTHFIVQERQAVADSSLAGTEYISERLLWQGSHYQILETSYSALKKASLAVAIKHPIIGVGPGQFGRYLPAEKQAGTYPEHLPNYDPHSTWLGALAETGIIGFFSLLWLSWLFYQRFAGLGYQANSAKHVTVSSPAAGGSERVREKTSSNGAILSCLVFLLLILILSVSKDVANFRFIWLIIGGLLGVWEKKRLPLSQTTDHG
ncbi:MAG: O-antigen ligase family protein [Bacteroidota bacterium]